MTTTVSSARLTESLPSESESQDRSRANALLIAGGLIALAHLPMLLLHAEQLWKKPHYQFFPLALAGSVFLAYSRLKGMGPLEPAKPIWCYPFVALFLLLLAASAVINSPWVAAVTSLFTVMAAILGVGGWPLAKRLMPAWLLLWLTIPLPNRLDQTVINGLQAFTARWSSQVLDMLGVLHVLSGNVVEIAEKKLLVEEACSGIHSLFASLACTIFFVLWARRPIIRSILLVLSAVFWVVICNVGRVVTVTVVEVYTDFNLTEGLPHEMLSLAIFACILGLVFSTDRLLLFLSPGFLFSQKRDETAPAEDVVFEQKMVLPPVRSTWLGSTPILVAYGVLAAVQLATFWGNLSDNLAIAEMGEEGLPKACAVASERIDYKYTKRDQDSYNEGDYSQAWTYRLGKHQVNVSLDYPFVGWHELTVCYSANGWTDIERVVHGEEGEDGTRADGYVEATMTKQPKLFGYLLYGVYDPEGKALEPVEEEFWRRLGRGAGAFRRVASFLGGDFLPVDKLPGPSYQVQVFVQTSRPLNDDEKKEVLAIFEEARARLTEKIVKPQEKT